MIIRNALVYYKNRLERLDISIDAEGRIAEIGQGLKGEDNFDASGHIVLPGLHNNHMHASTSLIRGVPVNGELDEWVSRTLWQFEKGLTKEEVYYGSLYSICQMLRSGITYFEDMHFLEAEVLRACEDVGIRATLSEALMDMNGWGRDFANIRTSLDLAKEAAHSGLVDVKLGIVSLRMTSEGLIDNIVGTYEDNIDLFSGFHIHMNETKADDIFSKRSYGLHPAQFFDNKGVLGSGTTIAHCVHMDRDEISLLSQRGVKVALCPASNMRLRSGVAPVKELLSSGVRVSLGLDSPAINDGFDMFADIRLLGITTGIPSRRLLPILLDGEQIVTGRDADLIFIDKRSCVPVGGLEDHLCLSMNAGSVDHAMVNGRFVVVDGKITTLDENKVFEKAEKISISARSRLDIP